MARSTSSANYQRPRPRGPAAPSYRTKPKKQPALIELRALVLAAGAIGGMGLLAFGGFYALRHASSGVPLVEAQPGPVRVKPADGGGAATIGSDEVGSAPSNAEGLAPMAEAPDVEALRQKFAPRPAPAPQTAAASPPGGAQAAEIAQLIAKLPPLVSTADAAAPEAAAATGPELAANTPPVIAAPVAPSTVMAAGGVAVQLGALASEAGARSAWEEARARLPDLLAGRSPLLLAASVAGHEVWRLRVSGFSDVNEAAGFCARLRARGTECTVAAF